MISLNFNFNLKDSFGNNLLPANTILIKILEEIPAGAHTEKIRLLRKKIVQDGLLEVDKVDFDVLFGVLKKAKEIMKPILLEDLLLYMEKKEKEYNE